MDYKEKYEQGLECIQEILDSGQEKIKITLLKERLLPFFPELESEDEKMKKKCINFLNLHKRFHASSAEIDDCITWLKKQSEHKPIMNVPTREVILSIWDLGNEWKELTNGSISTEYGTQLDYIQKHWHESEYYLREKQSEKKLTFNADDWYVSKVDGKIHNVNISSEKQNEQKSKEIKTTAYGTFGKYGAIEYVYILDYCSGRVMVVKHSMKESILDLFEKLGLKESQCQYMVSTDILSIEYINF